MDGEQNNVNPVGNVVDVEKGLGSSAGPIIGGIALLAVIILAGLYFWNQRVTNELPPAEGNVPTESVTSSNGPDDTSSIETDLNATDVDNIDAELNAS